MEKGYFPEIEKPVPLTNTELLPKYHGALQKAKLMYEWVEESRENQFALLKDGKGNIVVMYMDPKDEDVHTEHIHCDKASIYKEKEPKEERIIDRLSREAEAKRSTHKKEYIELRKALQTPAVNSMVTGDKLGLAAFNGKIILEPEFYYIHDITGMFIGAATLPVQGRTPEEAKMQNRIYDYSGRMWFNFGTRDVSITTIKPNKKDDAEYKEWGSIKLIVVNTVEGNGVYKRSEDQEEHVHELYAIIDGEMYSVFTFLVYNGKVWGRQDRLEAKRENGVVHQWSFTTIIDNATKLYYGDKPRFVRAY